MADHYYGSIEIGGEITKSKFEKLVHEVSEQCVEDLHEAIENATNGDGFKVSDPSASWGKFEDLETWLRENKIPYLRYTTAHYGDDAENVYFIPDVTDKDPENVDGVVTRLSVEGEYDVIDQDEIRGIIERGDKPDNEILKDILLALGTKYTIPTMKIVEG